MEMKYGDDTNMMGREEMYALCMEGVLDIFGSYLIVDAFAALHEPGCKFILPFKPTVPAFQ